MSFSSQLSMIEYDMETKDIYHNGRQVVPNADDSSRELLYKLINSASSQADIKVVVCGNCVQYLFIPKKLSFGQ